LECNNDIPRVCTSARRSRKKSGHRLLPPPRMIRMWNTVVPSAGLQDMLQHVRTAQDSMVAITAARADQQAQGTVRATAPEARIRYLPAWVWEQRLDPPIHLLLLQRCRREAPGGQLLHSCNCRKRVARVHPKTALLRSTTVWILHCKWITFKVRIYGMMWIIHGLCLRSGTAWTVRNKGSLQDV